MKKIFPGFFTLIFIFSGSTLSGQDTLPKFSVKNIGNGRIIIGWVNNYQVVKQISIQRSFDSLRNYKTILTVADPMSAQNGYVDTKATNDHMFYRLYILLDRGMFLFSDAKRPVKDTLINKITPATTQENNEPVYQEAYNDVQGRIKDMTKIDRINGVDSLRANMPLTINEKPQAEIFKPSFYVFTFKDGYVRINLPDKEGKKYSVKFFEDDGTPLFEIKEIHKTPLTLDKTNFYHAGWFKFELYEDGKLIDKNKFYLAKDF